MQRFEPIYHASAAVTTTGGGRWWKRHGLPVRPRPHPGEWAYGYLVRVAEANGYESPRALWRGLGPRRTGSISSVRYALRLSPAEWSFMSGPWPRFCRVEQVLAKGPTPSDYCHDHLRWCSHCLAEQRFLRARWVIKLCVACPEHGCYLRDTCAVCHQYQRPERAVLDRCLCGASLIGVPAERVAEDELRLQLAFQGALAGQAQEGAPSLSVAAWITLFHRVAALFDVERETRSGQTPGLHRLDRAIVVNRQLARATRQSALRLAFWLSSLPGRSAATGRAIIQLGSNLWTPVPMAVPGFRGGRVRLPARRLRGLPARTLVGAVVSS